MAGFARSALRRRVLRDARGLTPSIELPWSPPFGDELDAALMDLLADVLVLQADVSDERTWADDGAQRRTRVVDASRSTAVHADALAYRATAHALREIAASVRAWEVLAAQR